MTMTGACIQADWQRSADPAREWDTGNLYDAVETARYAI